MYRCEKAQVGQFYIIPKTILVSVQRTDLALQWYHFDPFKSRNYPSFSQNSPVMKSFRLSHPGPFLLFLHCILFTEMALFLALFLKQILLSNIAYSLFPFCIFLSRSVYYSLFKILPSSFWWHSQSLYSFHPNGTRLEVECHAQRLLMLIG